MEKFVATPIIGGLFSTVMGAFDGLMGKSFYHMGKDAVDDVLRSKGAAEVVQNVASGAGRLTGAVPGRVLHEAGKVATSKPVVKAAWEGIKIAGEAAVNMPQDLADLGTAAWGVGKVGWNLLTDTTTQTVKIGGKQVQQQVRRLRPIVAHGAVPTGLALGLGFGTLQGEAITARGFVHTGQMANMTNPVVNPHIRKQPMRMPYSYGADGNLVFALHNLRNG